ncbi:hypothetical protein Hanom_Chr00s000002g01600811 [Helianthus anomalus]
MEVMEEFFGGNRFGLERVKREVQESGIGWPAFEIISPVQKMQQAEWEVACSMYMALI